MGKPYDLLTMYTHYGNLLKFLNSSPVLQRVAFCGMGEDIPDGGDFSDEDFEASSSSPDPELEGFLRLTKPSLNPQSM